MRREVQITQLVVKARIERAVRVQAGDAIARDRRAAVRRNGREIAADRVFPSGWTMTARTVSVCVRVESVERGLSLDCLPES